MYFRISTAILAAVLVLAAAEPAQARQFSEACAAFATDPVVFVGRAGEPVHSPSVEALIQPFRAAAERAKTEMEQFQASAMKQFQASAGSKTMDLEAIDRELRDLTIKFVRATETLNQLIAGIPRVDDKYDWLTPMHIETAFRGVASSEVFVRAQNSGGSIEPGKSYLVYGYFNPVFADTFKTFIVETQRQPKEVDLAKEDLRFLNLAASGAHGTTVYGKLVLQNLNAASRAISPMAGITIRFVSDAGVLQTVTREDGAFIVSGVPPGQLEVVPALPPNLTVGEHTKRLVRDGGCIPIYLTAVLNGRIRGVVVADQGISRQSRTVELEAVKRRDRHFEARTNENGEFEITGVPPGDYLLGFGLSRPNRTRDDSCAATYYPGTANRDEAVPISVGFATLHDGFQLVLACQR